MDKIEELKFKRKLYYRTMCQLKQSLKQYQTYVSGIEESLANATAEYHKAEHDLALIDGRAQKYASNVSGKDRKQAEIVLTPEQIKRVLAQFGIQLPKKENEDES